jgi:hypothetical protein
MEKERNRNLMLYEFKCGHSAAAATRNICRFEGEKSLLVGDGLRNFGLGKKVLEIKIVRDDR